MQSNNTLGKVAIVALTIGNNISCSTNESPGAGARSSEQTGGASLATGGRPGSSGSRVASGGTVGPAASLSSGGNPADPDALALGGANAGSVSAASARGGGSSGASGGDDGAANVNRGGVSGSSGQVGGSSGSRRSDASGAGGRGDASGAGGRGGGASGSVSGDAGLGGMAGSAQASTGGTLEGRGCPSLPGAPAGTPPLPTPAQVAYQRTEMTSFIHFGMATFDGTEQCTPSDPVTTFAPTKLDATSVGQWVTALKGAGFRQAMLVTKHSCGFVLWPSKYTDYSTKNSTWKGDVLQLWSDAMKANDMRIAIYYSPWDQHYPSSKTDYEAYLKNQLSELMRYGTAYEFEFDGFNAPTSGNVNWQNVFEFIRQSQPDALIWAGPEIVNTGVSPDVQWIGNENGMGTRSTSALDTSNCGKGNTYCPYECNTSSHRPNWFWHPGQNPIALADMQKNYFQTVGMNCTFNFNVPPSTTGEFDAKDVALLEQFGAWYHELYKNDLLKGQPAVADSTWSTEGFEASKAVDDDICSYWAGGSGKTSASLTITPDSPITINLISIREAIELGERVKKYHVELRQNGSWVTAPTDKSGTKIQGTVIGNRQLWQLSGAKAEAVRLVIDSARDTPTIAEFSAY